VKYRTRTEQYRAPHTVDGETVEVTKTREVHVPVLPPDWDSVAIKAAAGLVLTLTVLSVVWSTWSIGSLLGGGVIGYMAAVIFDVSWATTLLLEWLARYDATKRRLPRVLGWMLLVVTMGAIAAHGLVLKNPAMAVVGALVSAVAKVLWLALTRHVDRELSADDRQWVAAQISQANAELAVANVRRQVSRMKDRVAAELLAAELSRPAELRAEQDTRQATSRQLPEPAERELPELPEAAASRQVPPPAVPVAAVRPLRPATPAAELPDSEIAAERHPATDESAQVSEPELPEPAGKLPVRVSQVATVRQVAEELGTTDPAAVLPAVAARLGKQPNQETVTRELRRIRKAAAGDAGNSGMYL
jgi:hypothetical protein